MLSVKYKDSYPDTLFDEVVFVHLQLVLQTPRLLRVRLARLLYPGLVEHGVWIAWRSETKMFYRMLIAANIAAFLCLCHSSFECINA